MLEELAETVNVDDPRNVTLVIIILIIKLNTSADNHTDTYKHSHSEVTHKGSHAAQTIQSSSLWRRGERDMDSSACFRPHSQWVVKRSWGSVCSLHHRVDSSSPWSSACPLHHRVVSSHFLWTLVFFSFYFIQSPPWLSYSSFLFPCVIFAFLVLFHLSFVFLLFSPFSHVLHTTFLFIVTPHVFSVDRRWLLKQWKRFYTRFW